jgi:hypothetical protein
VLLITTQGFLTPQVSEKVILMGLDPLCARRDAAANPIPLAAPVTMATLLFTMLWAVSEPGLGIEVILKNDRKRVLNIWT